MPGGADRGGRAARLAARLAAPPRSLAGRCSLIAADLAATTAYLFSYSPHGVSFGWYRIDLNVYRIGGRVWLHHGNLYGPLPPTRSAAHLPFSYPPVAAALLSPLTLPRMVVAGTALTLASVALTALVLAVFLRSAAGTRVPGSLWTIAWLLPVALALEPVRNTLNYGQINAALMALVSLDCLLTAPSWPRGTLVGFAAAIKLTPAAFVLFFLVRRDWQAIAATAAAFMITTGIGFLVAWHDSLHYWTSLIFQTSRPGNPVYTANQSILGVLARAGLEIHAPAETAVWLTLSAAVVAVAYAGMRHALACASDAWALCLNAFAGLLISPISWSHHWIWCAPGMLTLAVLSWRHGHGTGKTLTVAGLVMFAAAPQWWLPHGSNRELRWAGWEQVIGSSYVFFAVIVLLLSAYPAGRRPARVLMITSTSE